MSVKLPYLIGMGFALFKGYFSAPNLIPTNALRIERKLVQKIGIVGMKIVALRIRLLGVLVRRTENPLSNRLRMAHRGIRKLAWSLLSRACARSS